MIKLRTTLLFTISLLVVSLGYSANFPIEVFDLSKYSQNPNSYLPTSSENYKKPLISKSDQNLFLNDLISHSVGDDSPWSKQFVESYLQKNNIATIQHQLNNQINNDKLSKDYKVYQENYRLLNNEEYKKVISNIALLDSNELKYNKNNRAIITKTTMSYTVPYDRPLYYDFKSVGNGYPFSTINQSSVNIGQAIYIVSTSIDKKWLLVLSDSFYGWVKADSVSKISDTQIKKWQSLFIKQRLSVRDFNSSILSNDGKSFLKDAFPGTMLPIISQDKKYYDILIPTSSSTKLKFVKAKISKKSAVQIPLVATPENFVKVISQTIGYPYGWGNQYFYNDCSSEIRSIYQTFGIWLPRNSSDQGLVYPSINLDNKTPDERIKILMDKGRPLLDFIELKGHVMIYFGKGKNINNPNETVPIIYQQSWGLRDGKNTKRSIIGMSNIIPLLNLYPQDTSLKGEQAGDHFRIVQISKP